MKTLGLTIGALLAAAALQAQEPDAKTLYEKNCKMCHGVDGTPSAPMAKMWPALVPLDAKFMASRPADSVVAVLTHGTKNMKPLKGKLTPEEMAAVAKYVREELAKSGSQ